MDDKRIFRKSKDMVHRVIGKETILLPVYRSSGDIDCIYTLNKAAAWVWDKIDGQKTVGSIKRKAFAEFKTKPALIERKLGKLISELEQIKAIA